MMFKVNFTFHRDADVIYGNDTLKPHTDQSIGIDLRACFTENFIDVPSGSRKCVPLGISIEPISKGIAGYLYSRSGVGAVKGLILAQGVGIIDPELS